MNELVKDMSDEKRVDAGRGVPLDRRSKDRRRVDNQSSSDENERLDERIRKAGI